MKCSPAIDAGDNSQISVMTDYLGSPRNVNAGIGLTSIVDMGAMEFQSLYQTNCNCPIALHFLVILVMASIECRKALKVPVN